MDASLDTRTSDPVSPTGPIRLLLADPHPILLHGLRALLREQADFRVVASLSSAAGLIEAVERHRPELVLMALQFQDGSALSVIQALGARPGGTPRLVVLTATLTHADTCALIEAGVSGLLLKAMPTEVILQCLRQVQAGGIWFERYATGQALESLLRGELDRQTQANQLTPREQELAALIAQGRSIQAMAVQLTLSEGTVRNYLNRLYAKLGVANRAELAHYVHAHSLAEPPPLPIKSLRKVTFVT